MQMRSIEKIGIATKNGGIVYPSLYVEKMFHMRRMQALRRNGQVEPLCRLIGHESKLKIGYQKVYWYLIGGDLINLSRPEYPSLQEATP